jgi:hypothetical protein
MTMVEAVWGQEAEARRHAEEVLAIGQRTGSTFLAGVAEWTFGLIDLAGGRNAEAAARLLTVTDSRQPGANPMVAVPAFPDAVEAAARCGRAGELGERFAALKGGPWPRRREHTWHYLPVARRCLASDLRRRPSEWRSSTRRRCRHFSVPARSCFTVNGCAVSGGAPMRVVICVLHWKRSGR